MKVGIFQFSPEWGEVEKNLEKIERQLRQCPEVDLWILPELCTTGYQFLSKKEVERFAEIFPGGRTADKLQELTKAIKNTVVLGVVEKEDGKVYNSAAIFDEGKCLGTYRKIHLFYKEKLYFAPGENPPKVFNVNGVNIGVMICFDWIFPETARTLSLQGAELIAHPANLVLPYCQNAMITRSIENRVFTATANRVGSELREDEQLTFTGKSQITNPFGERVGHLNDNEENTLIVDLDTNQAKNKQITKMNNLFDDRKSSLYIKN